MTISSTDVIRKLYMHICIKRKLGVVFDSSPSFSPNMQVYHILSAPHLKALVNQYSVALEGNK